MTTNRKNLKKKKPEKPRDSNKDTAKAVIAERRKWQKKVQDLELQMLEKHAPEDDPLEQQFLDAGFDESTAKLIKNVLSKKFN